MTTTTTTTMEYINLHTADIDSDQFQEADPPDRSTWLMLLRYCVGQENGGRIEGCKGWSDRKWVYTCRVNLGEVEKESNLWSWDGQDLLLEFYPSQQEATHRALSRAGKKGARSRWNGQLIPKPIGGLLAETQAETEAGAMAGAMPNIKESKEKEDKEREVLSLSPDIPSLEEVRTWADMSNVDPDFAAEKWAAANEDHGWLRHGRVIDWRKKWRRFWDSDSEGWLRRKRNRAATAGNQISKETAAGTFRRADDAEWWWEDELDSVTGAWMGMAAGPQRTRLGEIVEHRQKHKLF